MVTNEQIIAKINELEETQCENLEIDLDDDLLLYFKEKALELKVDLEDILSAYITIILEDKLKNENNENNL